MVHVFRQAALTTVLLSFSTMNPVSVPSRGHLSRLPTTPRWLHSHSPPHHPLLASHVNSLQGGPRREGCVFPTVFLPSSSRLEWPLSLSTHSPSEDSQAFNACTSTLAMFQHAPAEHASRIATSTSHLPLSAHTRLPKLYKLQFIYTTYPLHDTKKSARSDKASRSSFRDANEFSQPDFLDFLDLGGGQISESDFC